MKKNMPKISACAIVKNEEKNLPTWLHCVKQLADEIIVVDTGSTDRTVEIAQAGGAKVYHFKWIDDFAAAKNFAIDQATGGWIIFLDADEWFDDENCPKVMEWIKAHDDNERVVAMFCRRLEYDKDSHIYKGDTFVDRVFRNLPTLRYVGRIHEFLSPSDDTKPILQYADDIKIMHTGYSASVARDKVVRNLGIILSEQDRRGEIPSDNFYLADCYFGLRQFDKAADYARRAIDSGTTMPGMENHIHTVLIQSLEGARKYDEAIAAAERAIKEFPDLPDFYIQCGIERYIASDYDGAARDTERGLTMYEAAHNGTQKEKVITDDSAGLLPVAQKVRAVTARMSGDDVTALESACACIKRIGHEPDMLKLIVDVLRASGATDDDVERLIDELYDMPRDARKVADSLKSMRYGAIAVHYEAMAEKKGFTEFDRDVLMGDVDKAAMKLAETLPPLCALGRMDAVMAHDKSNRLKILLPRR